MPVRFKTLNDNENVRLAIDVVVAHLANNTLAAEAVPNFIRGVYQAINDLCDADEASLARQGEVTEVMLPQGARKQVSGDVMRPAVAIENSIFHDHIVCLEDGKHLKMLKRYLMTHYRLTPAAYRQKWGLPEDYPMVAPSVSVSRKKQARSSGLGRTPRPNKP